MKTQLHLIVAFALASALASPSHAVIAVGPITDPDSANGVGTFAGDSGEVLVFDEDAVTPLGNDITVFTLVPGDFTGGGFSVSLSNGENGYTELIDGLDPDDVDNTEPLDPAIAAVNSGGRLQNGNVLRASAWFQVDPNDPITFEPSVEPVFKWELWKEFDGNNGDFTSGRAAQAGFGDRLWDSDINAPFDGDPFSFDYSDQSDATRIDLNNNGSIANGDDLTGPSLAPTTTEDEWVLVESLIVIDDTPNLLDPTAGWQIGTSGEHFVDRIERVTATLFVGDFGAGLNAPGGSFWIDNVQVEVFADMASVTPNTNPRPEATPGLAADFNGDGVVDLLDLDILGQDFGMNAPPATADANGDGVVDLLDLDILGQQFGMGGASSAIPEPTGLAIGVMGVVVLARRQRRR